MNNGHTAFRRIFVAMPTMSYTQRRKLEGLLRYVRERHSGDWRLQLELGGFDTRRVRRFAEWKCDGIIAYIDDPALRSRFLSAGLPSVLIEPFLSSDSRIAPRDGAVFFVNDHAREGATAAEYFLSRHFKSFAFVGAPEKTPWSRLRERGFVKRLRAEDISCRIYPDLPEDEREDFAKEMPRLVEWLKGLPRPTAVFAAHDLRARQILTAADAAGVEVPQHVAVLGVDDDELICETASPALSSIPTQDESLGYACGRALEELFRGHPGGKVIKSNHTHVVSRASTDLNALDDAFVTRALKWVRRHLAERPSIDAVADGIGYSKRLLQSRARRALGHSLRDEIRRMMLSAAAEMLVKTDLSVTDIAGECGFSSYAHLSRRFKERYRLAPLAYRKSTKLGN